MKLQGRARAAPTGTSVEPEPAGGAPELEVRHYAWREVWRRVWPLLRPHRWRWSAAAILVTLVGMAVAVMPLFPKYVIDTAIPAGRLGPAMGAAGLFLLTMFIRMCLWFLAMVQVLRIDQEVVFELRTRSFAHLQRLCLRFHNRYPSGFLYERVFGNSINTLGSFMQMLVQQLAVYVSGLVFSLGFCLYLSPPLTGVILAGACAYGFVARRMSARIYAKTRLSNEAHMRVVDLILDKLRGHKTIQSFAIEDRVQDEFAHQLWPVMTKRLDACLETTRLGFVTEGLGYLVTAVVVVGGASLVMSHAQPVGTLVAFMGYQGTLIGMISALSHVYGQFAGARSAFDQLFTVLDTRSTIVDAPRIEMPASVRGQVEFQQVTFGYGRDPVIRDFSAVIPAGQTVALVGRSGSGKSTVTNLLMRFYDPPSGRLLLDGCDIREYPLHDYRAQFAVVLQDPYLFDTSIATNLRYIRPGLGEAEMIEVLKRARAWDFVREFPDGLNHRVGEAGNQLSGGQRQRLAIARCMLVDCPLLILDEATSALDAESEALVQQAFDTLFKGRTCFIIAHRLSTIRRADRILVMDQGRLVEEGTYDGLLGRQGLFAYLHGIATSTSTHRIKLEEAGFA